ILTLGDVSRPRFSHYGPWPGEYRSRGAVRHWDAATGKPLDPPVLHQGDYAGSRPFSPDGKLVLTLSDDQTAQVWDVARPQPAGAPLVHPDRIVAGIFGTSQTVLTISSDSVLTPTPQGGGVLTGGQNQTFRLWEADTGKPIGKPISYRGKALEFSHG